MTQWLSRGAFPQQRFRRLRRTDWLRDSLAETRLRPSDLVYPVFIHEGSGAVTIPSLPGQNRVDLKALVELARQAVDLGVSALALFPSIDVDKKDEAGTEAFNSDNLVCRAVRTLKESGLNLGVVCDVALDPFTSHGQDGLVKDGIILNDQTNEALIKQAINQAQAGCDIIAPSDMMDGRIGAIREGLDEAGFPEVVLMSYAAKYASAFYGPFRDAVGSKVKGDLKGADKRTYQMDFRNSDEALHEVAADLKEGADVVMVKPGLPYLDIIQRVKSEFRVPVASYHVSGEYAMIKAAGSAGMLDAEQCMIESLSALKRAGSDWIFSYAALEIATVL